MAVVLCRAHAVHCTTAAICNGAGLGPEQLLFEQNGFSPPLIRSLVKSGYSVSWYQYYYHCFFFFFNYLNDHCNYLVTYPQEFAYNSLGW